MCSYFLFLLTMGLILLILTRYCQSKYSFLLYALVLLITFFLSCGLQLPR